MCNLQFTYVFSVWLTGFDSTLDPKITITISIIISHIVLGAIKGTDEDYGID